MMILLALLAFGQVPPGPLDAFRANFASIRADVDYTYEFGTADSSTVEKGRLWKGEVIGFTEQPNRSVIGRWSYDGTTERYEGRTPDAALQEARKLRGDGGIRPFFIEPFELIFDGERAAWHTIKGESTDRMSNILAYYPRLREPPMLGGAPFYWWGKSRFPIIIEDEFREARRERVQSIVNGFRTELEIYTKNTSDAGSLEVHYDPTIGYIPRYARVFGPGDARSHGFKELYMLDARPCAAGGFVPFEWYEVSYYVDDFRWRYPSYDYKTIVRPSFHLVGIGHYRAVRMTDRTKPVALEKLAGITRISADGGSVSLPIVPDRMGFGELETRLRRVLAHPKPSMPAIDIDEVRKFLRPPTSSAGWYAILPASSAGWYAILGVCLTVLLFGAGLFALRRRGLFFLLIGLIAISSGCGRAPSADRPPRLTVEVTPSFLIYEPNAGLLDISVTVKNNDDRKIKIFQASGGCSCRKLDQSVLPAELSPGHGLTLPARILGEKSYGPHGFVLALATDRGIVELPVRSLALPRHNLSPGSVHLGNIIIDEDKEKETSFELVHREVIEKAKPRIGSSLVLPPQFSVRKLRSRQQDVLEKPGLAYVDTTYILSLVDRGCGLKKSIVAVKGDGGEILCETSVVWQGVPYLSSSPAKIYLGSRPIRAFLICPDETIELTRVLAAPPGIKAVVSSTREVTVAADSGAPEAVDGLVEVGTTATGRPRLCIPVVRYAPARDTAAP